jgi:hypothetical protein
MFHVVGCFIRSRQECIVKNGVALRIRSNILIDVHYHKVKLGAHQAIMQSFKVRLERTITKNDILTINQEVIMFFSDHCSLKTQGLNNKFVYNLCMYSFFIRAS